MEADKFALNPGKKADAIRKAEEREGSQVGIDSESEFERPGNGEAVQGPLGRLEQGPRETTAAGHYLILPRSETRRETQGRRNRGSLNRKRFVRHPWAWR